MKVTNLRVCEFNRPVSVMPGDTLRVTHEWTSLGGISHKEVLVKETLNVRVTWTHSILFDLDGVLNHIIGTKETVDWLASQEEKLC